MGQQEPANWLSAEVLGHMPAPGYTVYMIKVTGLDGRAWTVNRRYRQIHALHQQLLRVHGNAMPEIPGKKVFGNTDPAFVREREAGLQRYFAELVQLEQNARSPAFSQFLAGDSSVSGAALAPGAHLTPEEVASIRAALGAEEDEDAQLQRALAASRSQADDALRRQQEEELEESERIDRQREEVAAEARAQAAEEAAGLARQAQLDEEQRALRESREEADKEARRQLVREAAGRLPAEPEAGEAGRVDVQVRLRGGRQLRRAFREGDALRCVRDLVLSELPDEESSHFQLVEAMPRRVYSNLDQSLGDAGLCGRCSLLVEMREDY